MSVVDSVVDSFVDSAVDSAVESVVDLAIGLIFLSLLFLPYLLICTEIYCRQERCM
jgi:hypothetical protein